MSNLIRTGDLDFSDIKQNLKAFLSTQTELADYDFDGSVISTLIDLLAYNTHYNALYTNLAINEMFIDSASKRSSIASIAKLLGYTPKSVASSQAIINVLVSPSLNNSTVITLPAGTSFSTEISGTAYTFNLIEDASSNVINSSNQFVFDELKIYEGERLSTTYVKQTNSRFVIPDKNVDMATVKVLVTDRDTDVTSVFFAASSIVDATSSDNVYFVKHMEDDYYEIFFGDGTFGTAVPLGSTIKITYLSSNGAAANGASVFSYSGGANSANVYTITTVYASSGGAAEEDKESIRFFAPLSYQAQGRVVTANDYAALVAETYSNIEAVTAWGGQDNDPPQYGKVFISAKPYGRDSFSALEKYELRQGIVSRKGVITVTPEFVDPNYFDIEITSNVYYNPNATAYQSGELKTVVRDAINLYANDLSKFEVAFRHSTLTTKVNSSDKSIVSSINNIRVRRKIELLISVEANYTTNFRNPIAESNESTFYSTRFFLNGYTDRGYLKNNGTDIEFYTEDSSGNPIFQKVVGTIDFSGTVTLQSLHIEALYDDEFEFVFYPSSYDVIPPNGTIIRLLSKYVTVNTIVDSLSQSRSSRFEYIFTPSR